MQTLKRRIRRILGENNPASQWLDASRRAGLWFNEPITLSYDAASNEALWVGTSERIVELPFVLQTLGAIEGCKQFSILDVGSTESLLAYQLASMNYTVTAVDIRYAPLHHPNLRFVQGDILHLPFEPESFDCAIALSTIEHIGLGWYGDELGEDLDFQTVARIYKLLRSRGYLLVTVPFGIKAQTPVHRIYDKPTLDALLGQFEVVLQQFAVRLDQYSWVTTEDEETAAMKDHHIVEGFPGAVAMLLCRKV